MLRDMLMSKVGVSYLGVGRNVMRWHCRLWVASVCVLVVE